jgi:hypothetical protein
MTLLRIALAFLAVGALFVGSGWALGVRKRGNAVALTAEALLLTLLASLWFASLGHGGWVLVFLLLGLLSSAATGAAGTGMTTRSTALTTARYVVAGALLTLLVG